MEINVETAARCITQQTYALNKKVMGGLRVIILPPSWSYHTYYVLGRTSHEEEIKLFIYYFAGGRYLFGYGGENNVAVIKKYDDELGTTESLLNDLSAMLIYIENTY